MVFPWHLASFPQGTNTPISYMPQQDNPPAPPLPSGRAARDNRLKQYTATPVQHSYTTVSILPLVSVLTPVFYQIKGISKVSTLIYKMHFYWMPLNSICAYILYILHYKSSPIHYAVWGPDRTKQPSAPVVTNHILHQGSITAKAVFFLPMVSVLLKLFFWLGYTHTVFICLYVDLYVGLCCLLPHDLWSKLLHKKLSLRNSIALSSALICVHVWHYVFQWHIDILYALQRLLLEGSRVFVLSWSVFSSIFLGKLPLVCFKVVSFGIVASNWMKKYCLRLLVSNISKIMCLPPVLLINKMHFLMPYCTTYY